MLLRCLSSLLVWLMLLVPLAAQDQVHQQSSNSAGSWPQLYGPSCLINDAAATSPITISDITIPGVLASDLVTVFVGFVMEDSATNFNISSATIDGSAATEQGEEDGTGLTNTGFYSRGPIFNADV